MSCIQKVLDNQETFLGSGESMGRESIIYVTTLLSCDPESDIFPFQAALEVPPVSMVRIIEIGEIPKVLRM